MTRLRRSSCADPGWSRRRFGRGFGYRDESGRRLDDPAALERIASLVIPPAWRDVWICPDERGHLQAVGTDDAGRRQYLYHPAWRVRRDREKFDRVRDASARLPAARRRVLRDLRLPGMPRERAAAVAVRLLDLGCFRIGSDLYADENGSFGLTTLERRHLRARDGGLRFTFVGKSGVEHVVHLDDRPIGPALDVLRRRRGGSDRLLAWRDGRRWRDLDASTVNGYLGELFDDLTAKDFRTWHATVLAAASLATSEEPGDTVASRQRAQRAAIAEVAEFLGNTPAVARSSYVDPRLLDLHDEGVTIDPGVVGRRDALERAVRQLLS